MSDFMRIYREEHRGEPGRYTVTSNCQGLGSVAETGVTFKFRGVDASEHGFGCIVNKFVEKGSTVTLTLGRQRISFEIMWCESHLGIDDMYRVGLTSSDPNMNVELLLSQLGYLETITKHAS